MILQLLHEHGFRLVVWSTISLILGSLVALRQTRSRPENADPSKFMLGFGSITAGWSLINFVFAFLTLTTNAPPEKQALIDMLHVNQILNVGYIVAGIILLFNNRAYGRGAGLAVTIQGIGLLVLDGVLTEHVFHAFESVAV
jgi:hypothetical protein